MQFHSEFQEPGPWPSFDTQSSATCSYSYPSDATVTLTALPNSSSTFVGWTGACSGTAPCTLSMAESRSVRATFSRATTYRLTVGLRPPGTSAILLVTPPGEFCREPGCAFDYRPGTSVLLRVLFTTNFWWDPGQPCEGQLETCTVVMDQDRTLQGELR
jgi:hypothetical protein